ncbi:MAG TPA: nucleoside recognition protein [Clostridiaceae bacterium]|nr:nucleoside recognition protein [Clostridiaceae bacterium]
MLNYIWLGMLMAGFVISILNGNVEATTQAALESAGKAIELCIGLAGVTCLWTGIMAIAEKSGLVQTISKLMRPVLRFLFPEIKRDHPAMGAIVMNLAANFLGLGNAATPLGLKAMQELQKLNPKKDRATNAMCMFLILNAQSLQLIPATLIAIRLKAGSDNPTDIIGVIWLVSSLAAMTGIILAKLFSGANITSTDIKRKNKKVGRKQGIWIF